MNQPMVFRRKSTNSKLVAMRVPNPPMPSDIRELRTWVEERGGTLKLRDLRGRVALAIGDHRVGAGDWAVFEDGAFTTCSNGVLMANCDPVDIADRERVKRRLGGTVIALPPEEVGYTKLPVNWCREHRDIGDAWACRSCRSWKPTKQCNMTPIWIEEEK